MATRKGRWNRDQFELQDKVRIKNMNTGLWDLKGVITEAKSDGSADGSQRAFVVTTEDGNVYHRNASHIHHRSSN